MKPQPEQAICMGRGTIRTPRSADRPTLRWLLRGLHAQSTTDSLEKLIAQQPARNKRNDEESAHAHTPSLYVAELDRHVVGLAAILPDARDCAALAIAVDRSSQSAAAIRTRLAEVALATARDSGLLKVWLEVDPANTNAGALFKRFGYMPHRSRFIDGRCRSEFVLDLYHQINHDDPELEQDQADQSPSRSATA